VNPPESTAFQALADRFRTENPGASIQINRYDRATAEDMMVTLKASGTLSDIFQLPLNPDLLDRWMIPGDLAPLDEVYAQTGLSSVIPTCLQRMVSAQCHPWSIPISVHRANVLWYNQSLLEQAGINPAALETFDNWLSAAQKISSIPGVAPLALKDNRLPSKMALFETILLGTLGPQEYKGLWDGTTSWTSAKVTLALQRYKQMSQYVSLDPTPGLQLLKNGKAAMVLADDEVYPDAAQSMTQGKIVVGGGFSMLGGNPHDRLARAAVEGTEDPFWRSDAFEGSDKVIRALAIQAPGKIIIGGSFNAISGMNKYNFARLNGDGSLDTSFYQLSPQATSDSLTGTNGIVVAVAVLSDNKIILGGNFGNVYGQRRSGIARLLPDGSLDPNFNVDVSVTPGSDVWALAIQPDGHIIAGGLFSIAGDPPNTHRYIIRLDSYGNLDTAFNPSLAGYVHALAIQANGDILVGGEDKNWDKGYLVRLKADSAYALDPSFTLDINNSVRTLAVQSDGQILLGGDFTRVQNQPRVYVARLDTNLALTNFQLAIPSSLGSGVETLAIQTDGKIIAGGTFTTSGAASLHNLARFNAGDGTVDPAFMLGTDGPVYAWRSNRKNLPALGGWPCRERSEYMPPSLIRLSFLKLRQTLRPRKSS
jgi:uncharacterized delta-60 repeat protein